MRGEKLRVGVLVSGGGTNLQALLDEASSEGAPFMISVVISSKPSAFALQRAASCGVRAAVVDFDDCGDRREFTDRISRILKDEKVDLVCMAGFLRILDPSFFLEFGGRVMNTHPALLPAFGGKGMYGSHVYRAVIESGARFSGATVHFATAETDVGPIVSQGVVSVEDSDTIETLSSKVRCVELQLYPEAVRLYALGCLEVDGMRVRRVPPKKEKTYTEGCDCSEGID